MSNCHPIYISSCRHPIYIRYLKIYNKVIKLIQMNYQLNQLLLYCILYTTCTSDILAQALDPLDSLEDLKIMAGPGDQTIASIGVGGGLDCGMQLP